MFKLIKFILKSIGVIISAVVTIVGAFVIYDSYQRKLEEAEEDMSDDWNDNEEVTYSVIEPEDK